MALQPNQDIQNLSKSEFKTTDARILEGLQLDVSSVDHNSPSYYSILVAAVRHLKFVPVALLPMSTADALFECGLVTARHKKKIASEAFVHPRFTLAGDIIALEFASTSPAVKPFLLQAMQELYRLKSTSKPYVVGLCLLHRKSREKQADLREMRKLVYALRDLKEKPISDSKYGFFALRLNEMLIELNTRKMLGGPTIQERRDGVEWLRIFGNYGDTPVGPEYPQRKEALLATARSIFRRTDLYAGNFWRYSGDAMSIPGLVKSFSRLAAPSYSQHSLLSLFASQCFRESCALHSSDPNSTPGRGIFFSQPRMATLFFGADSSGTFSEEVQQKYDAAFKGMPGVLNDFKMASFAILRGGFLIQVPGSSFNLKFGRGAAQAHYSLFIPNDHLTGSFERAYLIPSSRINSAVIHAKLSFGQPPSEDTGDLADSILGRDKLSNLHTPPFIIGLTNISAMFSGLVAGLPLRADPLFAWENSPGITSGWRDLRERVHYRWYLSAMKLALEGSTIHSEKVRREKRDELLAPFERASIEIGNVATRLLNVTDLMFHRFAAWKHDLVPLQGTGNIPRLAQAFYGFNRMAQELDDPSKIPQLCLVNRHDLSIRPQPVGDPSTLTLRVDGEPRMLPPAGVPWDTAEFLLWRRAAGQHVQHYSSKEGTPSRTETNLELAFIKPDYIEY